MDTVKQNGERISKEQRSLISLRYKRITKAINTEFWDSTWKSSACVTPEAQCR